MKLKALQLSWDQKNVINKLWGSLTQPWRLMSAVAIETREFRRQKPGCRSGSSAGVALGEASIYEFPRGGWYCGWHLGLSHLDGTS